MDRRPVLIPELQHRAVELADARCASDIEMFGQEVPGKPGSYTLTDSLGLPVRSIADAGVTIRESVEWLQARGLATLQLSPEGIVVVMIRKPTRPEYSINQGV